MAPQYYKYLKRIQNPLLFKQNIVVGLPINKFFSPKIMRIFSQSNEYKNVAVNVKIIRTKHEHYDFYML